MQRIRYAGADYLADDRMTDAVIQYARALAERRSVEVVELPIGQLDGSVGRLQLLIGAGIPIAAVAAPSDGLSFDGRLADPEQERRLRRLTGGLTRAPGYLLADDGSSEFTDPLS